MKQRVSIEVRGREHTWGFPLYAEPEHIKDWRADGIKVTIVENTIPGWAVDLGLTRIWFRVQDVWKRYLRLW